MLRCGLRGLFLVSFSSSSISAYAFRAPEVMVQWTAVTRVVHVGVVVMSVMVLAVLRAASDPEQDQIYMVRRPKYSQEETDAVYGLIC